MPATFVISLDFELAWGSPEKWGDSRYLENSMRATEAARKLLEAFKEYDVSCTWATVGALFCENKEQFLEYAPEENLRPTYDLQSNSPYNKLSFITPQNQESFFCPSIVQSIIEAPKQELGSHTYCHYYCLEQGQSLEQFAADTTSCKRVASLFNHSNTSFVFPRNQVNKEYFDVLSQHGITAYRGGEGSYVWKTRSRAERTKLLRAFRILDSYVPLSKNTAHPKAETFPYILANLPSNRFFRPVSQADALFGRLKLSRMTRELRSTACTGGCYHVWFHPINFVSHFQQNMNMLKKFLDVFCRLRDEKRIIDKTMAEASISTETL